jgi:cyclopropane fatty-acyl-phospholipid synthase-like methyltransferase
MSYFDHFSLPRRTTIGEWIVKQVKKQEFKALKPYLKDTDAIIEIGPGWGEMQELLFQNGYRNYLAIEPNPTLYSKLLKKGIKVKNYLIPELQEEDHSFDIIFMSDVFEHLNGFSEVQIFIQQCKRILKEHGIICIASPDYLHWSNDFFLSDYTHSNITSVRRTCQLFQDNGIRLVSSLYLRGFITGFPATVLSSLIRMISLFVRRDKINNKTYKLILSFLRRFLVIGEKE